MIAKMVLLPMMPTTLSFFAISRMLYSIDTEVNYVSGSYHYAKAA